ncbi:LPS-assembly protein LptD [Hydrogenothermus marinus]|uniref:LPS-assembly protein n=1 Tax=Hydrogenothermus marinus TaxID=133270 RepID=A0A3M0C402_9AQUI|nr:LPS assembly protein LptD [Hydrogenothermus marinus]RMA97692.1 LPS-assembly protein [Hydrogenothermus marinus]
MAKFFRLFILTLLIFSFSFAEKVYLEANSIEKIDKDNIIAKGKVVLKYQDITVNSEKLIFNKTKKIIKFDTKTDIKSPKYHLIARKGWYNFETKNGEFYQVQISFENKYFIKAKKIEKQKDIFYFEKAKFSSCSFDQYDWFIYSFDGNFKKNDYLTAKNVFFFFCKAPLFYTPYFKYPTARRKTGFLPFLISQDTYNDFILKIPFYLVIDKSSDSTFTLDYRNKQGKGIDIEYRKKFSPSEYINLNTFFFKEKSNGSWWEGRNIGSLENRWLLESDGRFNLFNNTKLFLRLNIPSDKYFYEDFYNTSTLRYTSYTKSQILALTETKDFTVEINFDFLYDLSTKNNEYTLQRLPEVRFYWKERPLFSNIYYDFLSVNTNFYRKKGTRGLRSDNQFRFILSTPYKYITNSFEFIPRSTLYANVKENPEKNPSRNLVEIKDRVSSIFQKKYSNFTHNIIPIIQFNYINKVNQEKLPIFDKEDRIPAKKDIDLSLYNIFDFQNNNYFRWEISTGYTFLNEYYIGDNLYEGRKKPFRNSFIYSINSFTGENTLFYDFKKNQIVRTISSFSFPITKYFRYSMSHSFDKGEQNSTNQLLNSISANYKNISLNFSILSNIKEGYIQQKRGSLTFNRKCWYVKLDYIKDFNKTTGKSYKVITLTLNIINFSYNFPLLKPTED